MTGVAASAAVEQFAREGFCIQRGAVSASDVAALDVSIDECRRSPSVHHAVLGRTGDHVFDSDLFRWRDRDEIAVVIASTALVAQARRLLGSEVLFVEDQWFSADPGSASGSPWHQDGPYYEIDRDFATCWIPLEDVDAEHSLRVVPGSHVDGSRLDVVAFDSGGDTIRVADEDSTAGPAGSAEGGHAPHSPASPVVDTERAVSFDMAAGDALWFHSGTIHGLPLPAPGGGRRFSLRYAPARARRCVTGRTVAAFWSTLDHGVGDGELLATSEWFPRLSLPGAMSTLDTFDDAAVGEQLPATD